MLLTTKQVAKKLGVTTQTVNVWHKEGRFTGEQVGNGTERKIFRFHSKSVNDYAKTIKALGKGRGNRVISKTNGQIVHKPQPSIVTGIGTRLKNLERKTDQLEAKIDQLIKIWS